MKCREQKRENSFYQKNPTGQPWIFIALHQVKRTARSPKSCFTRAGSFSAHATPSPTCKVLPEHSPGLFTRYKVLASTRRGVFTVCKVHFRHSPGHSPVAKCFPGTRRDFSPLQGPSRVLAKVFHPVQRAWRSLAETFHLYKVLPVLAKDVLPSAELGGTSLRDISPMPGTI